MRTFRALTVAVATLSAGQAAAAGAPATQRNFVACPIIRDTLPTPCWVAIYKGEMYYLGLQQDTEAEFFPPQQSHKALIEGTVTNKARVCGGIPLEPVKASTLPEIDLSCRQVLPAQGMTSPPARRGAIPRNTGTQLATNPVDTEPPRVPPPPPAKPWTAQTFAIPFDYESAFMLNKATRAMQRAQRYALAVGATRVEIVGYRGSALLSDGKVMQEKAGLEKRRAEAVGEAAADIGFAAARISVRWKSEPEVPDGVHDAANRRVEMIVTP